MNMSAISTQGSIPSAPTYSHAKAKLQLERERRARQAQASPFERYRFDPQAYIKDKLGYTAWRGENGATGQAEVIDHYALVLKQLHDRRDFERGEKQPAELEHWQPGVEIQNIISVDAGHNVGKTTEGGFLVSHFFDCFSPSIIYCFAPSAEQINDLLFKEIRTQRSGKGLPGTVLEGEPRIKFKSNHFVKGKATDNSKGTGTERAQGQHNEYLMFVVDEAEGVPDYVFDAIKSMASGGIAIVLVFRNPRTTVCRAHKIRKQSNVKSFRISCLDHPNVVHDREIIPGSVRRQYVEEYLADCEIVNEHSSDDYTFEVPWRPGVIFRPTLDTLWRVLGIASAKGTDDTFCPPGRYDAACTREPYDGDDPLVAWVGVDAARYGNDKGTVYIRHAGRVWKECEIVKQDGFEYYIKVKNACEKLKDKGVKVIKVRADAGGGYSSTCVDNLNRDADLKEWFIEFQVIEVHNNGTPHDQKKFADLVTEMYADACERLKALRLDSPSPNLETDLTERKYGYVIKAGMVDGKTRMDLKQLVSKQKFKDKFKRSPDDGDGFVLAVAGDHLFKSSHVSMW
jgi:hypothetical protein